MQTGSSRWGLTEAELHFWKTILRQRPEAGGEQGARIGSRCDSSAPGSRCAEPELSGRGLGDPRKSPRGGAVVPLLQVSARVDLARARWHSPFMIL